MIIEIINKSKECVTFWCLITDIVIKSNNSIKRGWGIPIVVSPLHAKKVDMEYLYAIKHMLRLIRDLFKSFFLLLLFKLKIKNTPKFEVLIFITFFGKLWYCYVKRPMLKLNFKSISFFKIINWNFLNEIPSN